MNNTGALLVSDERNVAPGLISSPEESPDVTVRLQTYRLRAKKANNKLA